MRPSCFACAQAVDFTIVSPRRRRLRPGSGRGPAHFTIDSPTLLMPLVARASCAPGVDGRRLDLLPRLPGCKERACRTTTMPPDDSSCVRHARSGLAACCRAARAVADPPWPAPRGRRLRDLAPASAAAAEALLGRRSRVDADRRAPQPQTG